MKSKALAWKGLSILVSGVGVGALGYLLLWQINYLELDATSDPFGPLCVGILLTIGIVWASVIVHELGHLLAALAVRMRIILVIFGPLKFFRESGRFHVRINWRSTTPGCVIAAPMETRA